MADSPEQVVEEVGKLLSKPRLNKDALVKLLKQAENALLELRQSSSLQASLRPLHTSLVQNNLIYHRDKDVKLLVAVCFSEIMRILAPNPPFSDAIFKEIFRLVISTLADLADIESPYLPRRIKILENVAALRCSVIMLDIGCDDLVLDMFRAFFSVAKQGHQQTVFEAILSIMTQIIEEKVSQPLLDLILQSLVKEKKEASFKLAAYVVQSCPRKLERPVCTFLTSYIVNRDSSATGVNRLHHKVILELFQCSPQILFNVIPSLIHELLTDQVDVRLEAVRLVGKLLAISNLRFSQDYHPVYLEFLKRFSDKSADVRIAAIECTKACYTAAPSGGEAQDILAALESRLLDFDDKVRSQALIAACDLAMSNLKLFPSGIILRALERLRDKKISVRKTAMQKLLELYRNYCDKCSKGIVIIIDHYEQIPCKILGRCFDKACETFRPQNMELVLAEHLFPPSLSLKERTHHWVAFFHLFEVPHTKALNSILSQKKRLQLEMQVYLDLREKEKISNVKQILQENSSKELHKQILASFRKMSASFLDASRAEECFWNLHQMKDNNIFKDLHELSVQTTFGTAQSIRDSFLKRIGSKHPSYSFFSELSLRCSYLIFNVEIVQSILEDFLSLKDSAKIYTQSSLELLLIILTMFPSLIMGSEEFLLKLFSEESILTNEMSLQILANAGSHLSINISDIYPLLERKCLEGTRVESKRAVSAIASLVHASDDVIFSNLCKKLLNALLNGHNIPTVLQSLGCISQISPSIYMLYNQQIMDFVIQQILHSVEVPPTSAQTAPHDGDSANSLSCKMKIYGLKALVRSVLPKRVTHVRHQIINMFNIVSDIILEANCCAIYLSELDKEQLRLAAARSILRLATRWDSYISPKLFRLTIHMARNSSYMVRKSFICKTYRLLKEHSIPNRYVCAFAFASSDSLQDIRTESKRYLTEVLKDRIKNISVHHDTSGRNDDKMTNHPAYVLVFLMHVLAHDVEFPLENCPDEGVWAEFCSPLIVVLQALVSSDGLNTSGYDVNNSVSFLLGILQAVQKAEDAIDAKLTPKLHILSKLCLLIVKALSGQSKLSSDGPHLILLPSSYYKVCEVARSRDEPLCHECVIDESFVRRILKAHGSYICLPDDNEAEQDGTHENLTRSDMVRRTSNLRGRQSHSFVGKQTREKASASHSETGHQYLEPQKANSKRKDDDYSCTLEKDKFSSCVPDGVKMLSSDSKMSKEADSVECISLVENQRSPIERSSTEPNEALKSNLGLQDSGEALIGRRIRLWSAMDMCYVCGIVDSYDSESCCHKISYDNGEGDMLRLEDEKWELIDDNGVSKFQPKDCTFFGKDQKKVLPDCAQPEILLHGKSSALWSVSSGSSVDEMVNYTGSGNVKQKISSDERLGTCLRKSKRSSSSSSSAVQKSSTSTVINTRTRNTRMRPT